jgi:hypothetical protein
MTKPDGHGPDRVGCANEGCPRPAETGERWCSTCGLERALYRREARRPTPSPPEPPSGRATGGR